VFSPFIRHGNEGAAVLAACISSGDDPNTKHPSILMFRGIKSFGGGAGIHVASSCFAMSRTVHQFANGPIDVIRGRLLCVQRVILKRTMKHSVSEAW
jgi:hypothetical protein